MTSCVSSRRSGDVNPCQQTTPATESGHVGRHVALNAGRRAQDDDFDFGLKRVVEAWPTLDIALRGVILAVVDVSGPNAPGPYFRRAHNPEGPPQP